jgi:hypothetical protein
VKEVEKVGITVRMMKFIIDEVMLPNTEQFTTMLTMIHRSFSQSNPKLVLPFPSSPFHSSQYRYPLVTKSVSSA